MKILERIFQQKDATEYVEVRILDAPAKHPVSRRYFQDIGQIPAYIEHHKESNNVYFGVATRKAEQSTKDAFSRAFCLWADLDNCRPQDMPPFILPPSMVVISGAGLHLYWLLKNPCDDAKKIEQLNKGIELLINSDSVSDVTRILRVDGTYNHKRGNKEKVELIYDIPVAYSLADLTKACGLSKEVHQLAGEPDTKGKRSERFWRVLKELLEIGVSKEAIETVFTYQPIGDKAREEEDRDYLERNLMKAIEEHEKKSGQATTKKSGKKLTFQNKKVSAGEDSESSADSENSETVDVAEGIFVHDCVYKKVSNSGKKNEKITVLSNFQFIPTSIIKGDDSQQDIITGQICTPDLDGLPGTGSIYPGVTFRKSDFNSKSNFVSAIPYADCSWFGGDADVQKLMAYVHAAVPKDQQKEGVTKLGFHHNYWVGSNQVLAGGLEHAMPSEASPYLFLPPSSATIEVDYPDGWASKETIKAFFDSIFFINDDKVIYPMLGWWCASLFKSRCKQRFPILNVYGSKESGKTATLEIFQRLSGYTTPRFQVCNTTKFVLMALLSETKDVMVSLTEYRKSFVEGNKSNNLHQYLLTLYDGGSDSRGTKNQEVRTRKLTSPLTIDGEDAIDDPALVDRCIQVNFPKLSLQDMVRIENFSKIKSMDLALIGADIIKFSLGVPFDPYLREAESMCWQADIRKRRMTDNVIICLAGALFLKDYMYTRIKADLTLDCEWFSAMLTDADSNKLMVDDFIIDVVSMCASDGPKFFDYKYESGEKELWFHFNKALAWWVQKRRSEGRERMETKAIKSQLEDRQDSYFLGYHTKRTSPTSTAWCAGVNIAKAQDLGLHLAEYDPQTFNIIDSRKERLLNQH